MSGGEESRFSIRGERVTSVQQAAAGFCLCIVSACGGDASDPAGTVRDGSGSASESTEGQVADGGAAKGATPGLDDADGAGAGGAGAGGADGGPESAGSAGDASEQMHAGAGGMAGSAANPEDVAILKATVQTRLRLLTQVEYRNSVVALLGADTADRVAALSLPDDILVGGFASVGASLVALNGLGAERYEQASLSLASDVFSDDSRWPALVGCTPQADLSDACVESYIRGFGRRAFRRELSEAEASRWIDLARATAVRSALPNTALGLAAATAGILQSPGFLYRVEYAEPDLGLGRLRFDGPSMATRIAYLTTGTTPDESLLDTANEGGLNTTEGLRAAVDKLMASSNAPGFMPDFFTELMQLRLALSAQKDPEIFPEFDQPLQTSMLEETDYWLKSEVLAPGADVRALFTSTTTFVDAKLAALYGLPEPAQAFEAIELAPESGRSGILGKAAFLTAHSGRDFTSPTRRGVFILKRLICEEVLPPPPDLPGPLPEPSNDDTPKTTRQLMEQHLYDPECVSCHQDIDPLGYALEHLDPIGRYRETENGLPIDATGQYQGIPFDGAVELGQVLHDLPNTSACLVRNFYRYANGAEDDLTVTDAPLIEALATALADGGYVWRDWLAEFATSDAFTSLPVTVSATVE